MMTNEEFREMRKEKKKEQQKKNYQKYYEKNKDKLKEKSKEYYQNNKERIYTERHGERPKLYFHLDDPPIN